jgi:hypothetical protein
MLFDRPALDFALLITARLKTMGNHRNGKLPRQSQAGRRQSGALPGEPITPAPFTARLQPIFSAGLPL